MKEFILNLPGRLAFSLRAFKEAWFVSRHTFSICFSYGAEEPRFPDYMKKEVTRVYHNAIKKFGK